MYGRRLIEIADECLGDRRYRNDFTYESICDMFARTIVDYSKMAYDNMTLYTKDYPKLITGVVIDKNGNLVVRNAMRENILDEIIALKENPLRTTDRLKGLLIAARQAVPGAYEGIYNHVKEIDRLL